ncbi:unnamed protein product [Darwinula stevensoni]|uniref:Uncharacterized protein n=1 Tax=Darwinula stevensoni TaxID=69355 RepID=A0A7R8X1W4_9CRUS|nr:unnamed protein product [Darwinula stevensoni]CAG0882702.1 unnamed protein product [Darwinula stevensoni]
MIGNGNGGRRRLSVKTPKSSQYLLGDGGGKTSWCFEASSGFKIIVTCFAVFTVAVTTALIIEIVYGDPEVVPHGVVSTDNQHCSEIGAEILKKGGSGVDAAIAAFFCLCVYQPYSVSPAGGGYMLIHQHGVNGKTTLFNFREVTPSRLTKEQLKEPGTRRGEGGLWVGTSGLMKGLRQAHEMFGKLQWADLVTPSVTLARYGVPLDRIHAREVLARKDVPSSQLFADFQKSYDLGKHFINENLAETLNQLVIVGPQVFWNGSVGEDIIQSVKRAGGVMELQDLADYKVEEMAPLEESFWGHKIVTSGGESAGAGMLSALGSFVAEEFPSLSWSQLIQSLNVALLEVSLSGDSENKTNPQSKKGDTLIQELFDLSEPTGSAISVMAVKEQYVSFVSGLNSLFGAQVASEKGGFFLNSAMSNFFLFDDSDAPNNFGPTKHPLSFLAPVLAYSPNRPCYKRLVLGSSDFQASVQVLLHSLYLNESISDSVEEPRIYIGSDGNIYGEEGFEYKDLIDLRKKPTPYPSVNLLFKYEDTAKGHSDTRGGGSAYRF